MGLYIKTNLLRAPKDGVCVNRARPSVPVPFVTTVADGTAYSRWCSGRDFAASAGTLDTVHAVM
jgi:hypothetical protein